MDLRKNVIRRHLGKNEKKNPTGALRLLSSISFQDNRKREEMLRRWRQDMKAHDVKMKWERTKEKGSERKGWKDTYDRATKNVLGLLRLVTYVVFEREAREFLFFTFLHSNHKNTTRIAHSYRKKFTRKSMVFEFTLDYDEYLTRASRSDTGTQMSTRKES